MMHACCCKVNVLQQLAARPKGAFQAVSIMNPSAPAKRPAVDQVPQMTALERALLTARSGRAIVDFMGPNPSEFEGLCRLCRGLRRLHAVAPPQRLSLAHLPDSARQNSDAVNALVARAAANWPGLVEIDLAGFKGLTEASLLVVAERCPRLTILNLR